MKNKEEVSTLISKEIKEMGLNTSFDEEMISELKKAIFEKIAQENKLIEQEMPQDTITDPINIEKKPENVVEPITTIPSTDNSYTPTLPSFIDKIEPEKFIVFDRNELSVGGENLSNKQFRLVSNPDEKKSIHNTWTEDGKKRAEVFIAKLVKIGEITFDYTNGLSQYNEIVQEQPNTNNFGFQIEPFTEDVSLQIIDDEDKDNSLEEKMKNYIKELIKGKAENNIPTPVNESSISNNPLKMRDIIMDEKKYSKINTPTELKESIKNGTGKAILKSKNEEVQIWILEGKEYYMPTNIISDAKCHISKNKTI